MVMRVVLGGLATGSLLALLALEGDLSQQHWLVGWFDHHEGARGTLDEAPAGSRPGNPSDESVEAPGEAAGSEAPKSTPAGATQVEPLGDETDPAPDDWDVGGRPQRLASADPNALGIEGDADLPTDPDLLSPQHLLGALSKETIVFAEPKWDATKIGFLRTGALVNRGVEPVTRVGCDDGWYRIAPQGYVCAGRTATTDPNHPIIKLASVRPDRTAGLPYAYGRSRYPTPPLYTQIPTREQQGIAERDLQRHLPKNFGVVWGELASGPPPSLLAGGEMVPRPYGYPVLERKFMTGRALADSAFAFLDLFEADGRRWALTTDLSIVPLDRVTPVEASEFAGVTLGRGVELPLVFVRSRSAHLYAGDPEGSGLRASRRLAFREAVPITGRQVRAGNVTYLETSAGDWIRDQHLVRIDRRDSLPRWAKDRRTWLDISILRQTLVAYEGDRPVFATLVSSGRDGLGDPETTHSTIRGTFLVHTKHVSATMSGSLAEDEFDLRDVPYVQYFHKGFALHAAFWHDSFGTPRSHGCVNLSPLDARWLFGWTDPPVPSQWHSALSTQGTLVHVHP